MDPKQMLKLVCTTGQMHRIHAFAHETVSRIKHVDRHVDCQAWDWYLQKLLHTVGRSLLQSHQP